MSRYIDAEKLNGYGFGLISPYAQALFHATINAAKTEDVRRVVHGYWIENAPESQLIDPPYFCSECGRAEFRKENFCCSCGADMRGVKND